jgi:hypothetical protein
MRTLPLSDSGHGAECVPENVSVARKRESADDYPALVAVLNRGHRVIECRDAIQWVLQRRNGTGDWRGRSYCRSRAGLLRCIRDNCGPVDSSALAIIESLPTMLEAKR